MNVKKAKIKLPSVRIGKRQKFLLVAGLLMAGLFSTRFLANLPQFEVVLGLAAVSYLLSAWALSEGFSRFSWITTLILPPLFTAGVGFFYLLSNYLWLQLVIVLAYGIGFYSLLLTENIFAAASIRTIQLLRSAQTVGFLLTVLAVFFFYDTILSFKMSPFGNFAAVGLISLPLLYQGVWCCSLCERMRRKDLLVSVVFALILAQLAFVISFWPVSVPTGSLALTAGFYIILNLCQHDLNQRLFAKTIKENLVIALLVFLVVIMTTGWGK